MPQDFVDILSDFVRDNFAGLEFELKFNPHGYVENVAVSDLEIKGVYILEIGDDGVLGEATVSVHFAVDFSYKDLETGLYDRETGEHFMTQYVRGEVEQTCEVSVGFTFSIGIHQESIVSDLSFRDGTITVQEEDRGDYDQWK